MAGSSSDQLLRQRQAQQNARQSNQQQAANFGDLSPYQQNNFASRNLTPNELAQYQQAVMANQAGQRQSGYNNQIGDLLYSLMGLSGYGGNGGGGYGGGGYGGGGGGAPPDIGLELGLERDKINADRSYTGTSRGNQVGNELLAQLQQNMQRQQAPLAFNEQKRDFYGQQASKGAFTTAGTQHDYGQMADQYHQLLKQLSLQNQGLQYGRAQSQQDFDYANKQNDFSQQGLDIQAGKAGYNNPFTIPNPTPVQRKTV